MRRGERHATMYVTSLHLVIQHLSITQHTRTQVLNATFIQLTQLLLSTIPYTTQGIPPLQYSLLNVPVRCVALPCVALRCVALRCVASACLRNCCVPCSLFVTTSTLLLLFVELSCVVCCDVVAIVLRLYLR